MINIKRTDNQPFTEMSDFLRFPLAVMVVMIHAHMTINVCVGAELTKWGGCLGVI